MADVSVRLKPRINKRLDRIWVARGLDAPRGNLRLVSNEEAVQVPSHEPRSRLLTGDDVNDVFPVEVPPIAKKLFLAIIVIVFAI